MFNAHHVPAKSLNLGSATGPSQNCQAHNCPVQWVLHFKNRKYANPRYRTISKLGYLGQIWAPESPDQFPAEAQVTTTHALCGERFQNLISVWLPFWSGFLREAKGLPRAHCGSVPHPIRKQICKTAWTQTSLVRMSSFCSWSIGAGKGSRLLTWRTGLGGSFSGARRVGFLEKRAAEVQRVAATWIKMCT